MPWPRASSRTARFMRCASSSSDHHARRSRRASPSSSATTQARVGRGELVGEHAVASTVGERRALRCRRRAATSSTRMARIVALTADAPLRPRRSGVGRARPVARRASSPRRRRAACRPAAASPGSPEPASPRSRDSGDTPRSRPAPLGRPQLLRRRTRRGRPAPPTKTSAYLRSPLPASRSGSPIARPTRPPQPRRLGDRVRRRGARRARLRQRKQRRVDLAAHRVADDAEQVAVDVRAKPPRDRIERADAAQRHAEPVREPLRGRHADAHAGERARTPADDDLVDVARSDADARRAATSTMGSSRDIAARGASTIARRRAPRCRPLVAAAPTPTAVHLGRGVEREQRCCSRALASTGDAATAARAARPTQSRVRARAPSRSSTRSRGSSSPVDRDDARRGTSVGHRLGEAVAPLDDRRRRRASSVPQ